MFLNLEKYINSALANSLADKEWYFKISLRLEELSQLQLAVILALALALVSFMIYKKLGQLPLAAWLFFCLLVYALYQFDLIGVHEARELNKFEHMQEIQKQLDS